MASGAGRATVRSLDEEVEDLGKMAEDVRAGLLSVPKDLSPWPKYFYDARGSEIFEEITEQPEYYQTRTELSILEEKAPEIVRRTRCRELVELGSGSASKTRALLDAMMEAGEGPVRYVPFDVSESAVTGSAERLLGEYPELEIRGYVGDFDRSLERLLERPDPDGPGRLVIFLGGTLGNFTPERRREFLGRLKNGLGERDHLLIGVDLVKDPSVIEAAYDDSAGVTAAFNKNLLEVLNRKLGGEFDPDLFAHRATYNHEDSRLEMWLDSEITQNVPVAALDIEVSFEYGEGMRTEISTKFTCESVTGAFGESGLRMLDLYIDDQDLFGLALGTPA
ncbi:MAG: L-histidine N(alpha)-methyltransferase [uncultured Rubrobacteraceae bacterium]|uniref:L-histidine N(Alpha)-methyltransferase n=1 Tax=uncultured Rubrobacteraceae bacterium TaxID=349277 RepID=A0A6J4QU63_9ACTN|nr:MAG: L-histidine N(alpha)-methyltransferase [uncultured Rubrobacteraceae bacterium]